jgi:hypothetical protein
MQRIHPGPQPRNVELVNGENPVAALCTPRPAHKPLGGLLGCARERSTYNLHKFAVCRRQSHCGNHNLATFPTPQVAA